MNSLLLNRALGSIGPQSAKRVFTTDLVHALSSAKTVTFDGSGQAAQDGDTEAEASTRYAHHLGVNALTLDKWEGRYLISGGADPSIHLWDLESAKAEPSSPLIHRPLSSVGKKSPGAHKFGITGVNFFPFDSLAFLSSSFDHTIKAFDSESLKVSASFDLESVVYSHAISPIASHLLVACATQHPSVRLVDLRSGSASHSLPGHTGTVMTVAWHPQTEHILCSGGVDGTVRLWDIRRSAGELGRLDVDDSAGVLGRDGTGRGARSRHVGQAHHAAVNGVTFTEDGQYLVTNGHDEQMRVWNAQTGANTLASFGPYLKNSSLSALLPLVAPLSLLPPGRPMVFYPSEKEIIMFDLLQGRLLKRLKVTATVPMPVGGGDVTGRNEPARQRNLKNLTTALCWKAHDVALFSAHADGTIRTWQPHTSVDEQLDRDESDEEDAADEDKQAKKRKRAALEDLYQDVMGKKVVFT